MSLFHQNESKFTLLASESETRFRGILTDWCCHADAVTGLMLDRLMIYGEWWDAQNGTRVNVHLSRRTSSLGGCPQPVQIQPSRGRDWLTDWLTESACLQLNPAHTAGREPRGDWRGLIVFLMGLNGSNKENQKIIQTVVMSTHEHTNHTGDNSNKSS